MSKRSAKLRPPGACSLAATDTGTTLMISLIVPTRSRTVLIENPRSALAGEGAKSTRMARRPARAPSSRRLASNAASFPAIAGSRSSVSGDAADSSASSASRMALGAGDASWRSASSFTRCSIARIDLRSVSVAPRVRRPPDRSAARRTASIRCEMATAGSTPTIAESPLIVCRARKRSRTARGLSLPSRMNASISKSLTLPRWSCSSTSAT